MLIIWFERTAVNATVVDSIPTQGKEIFNIFITSRKSVLSGAECVNTWFPLHSLFYAIYNIKLISACINSKSFIFKENSFSHEFISPKYRLMSNHKFFA